MSCPAVDAPCSSAVGPELCWSAPQRRTDTFNAKDDDQEVHEEYDPAQSQRGFQAHPVKVCALAATLPWAAGTVYKWATVVRLHS